MSNSLNRHLFLFTASIFYAFSLCQFHQLGDSLFTIAFLLAETLLFFKILAENKFELIIKKPVLNLLLYQCIISLGLFIGLYWGGSPNSILWPLDAVYTHVPVSENVSQALQGLRTWQDVGFEIPGVLTHAFTGMWFYLIGTSIYASALSLLCFKLGTILFIYLLGEKLFDPKTAYFSSLIYLLAPTVQFYTLNFYKEATIHFLMATSFYFIHLLFSRQRFWALPLLGLSFYFLAQERFYLIFLFIPTLAIVVLFSSKKYRLIKVLIFASLIGILIKNNIYLQQSPQWMLHKIEEFRQAHMKFNDFSYKYNYEIPYVLAFIKTLFTPYFTYKKIVTFLDLGNLLTWGSFINQGIIASSLYSMAYFLKRNWRLHLSFILPFLILVSFLAYISPWSGRVRDSFYPIIALYSGAFFSAKMYQPILAQIKNIKNKIKGS